MAPKDKTPKGPPRIDRSKQINSMSKVMRDAGEATKKQQQMSRSINSLMVKQLEEQKNTAKNKRTPLAESKDVKEIHNSVNEILKKLGYVVDNLSQGTKKITLETAKATKEAIAEYGRAVSSDISVNKQNIVAMAIAKSSPILGYFTSKFFETTIFKRMAEKTRQKFQDIFSGVGDKFKIMFSRMIEGFKNFFHIGKRGRERGEEARFKRVPAMQSGGYVEKGGLAKLHAAEVVVPVEKFLKTIKESFTLAKEDNKRIIEELRLLRYGLLGFMGEFQTRLVKTFMDFPLVRKLAGFFGAVAAIGKFFTYARGKYRRMLPTTGNPLGIISGTLGLIFTQGMYKLDVIIHHLATLVKCVCGKEPILPNIGNPTTRAQDLGSRFGLLGLLFGSGRGAGRLGTSLKNRVNLLRTNRESQRAVEDMYGVEKPEEKRKRILSNVLRFVKSPQEASAMISVAMGEREARIAEAKIKAAEKASKLGKGAKEKGSALWEMVKGGPTAAKKFLSNIWVGTKSVAWSLWQWTKFFAKLPFKAMWFAITAIGKASWWIIKLPFRAAFWSITKLPKLIMAIPGAIWGMGKFMVKSITGTLKFVFLDLLVPAVMGMAKILEWGVTKMVSLLGHLAGVGGRVAIGAGRMAVGAGSKIGKGWARRAGGAGKAALGAAGGLVGGAIGIMDAMDAMKNAKDWGVRTSSAAIGGFLGGKGGAEGAMEGVAKGAGIGMMLGSVFPGVGTAIGGAIGAIAGGILGFVGAENISKFIDPVMSSAEEFVKGIYDFIMWPFRTIKSLYTQAKEFINNQIDAIKQEGIFGYLFNVIVDFAKLIGNLIVKIKDVALDMIGSTLPLLKPVLEKLKSGAGTAMDMGGKALSAVGSAAASEYEKSVAAISARVAGEQGDAYPTSKSKVTIDPATTIAIRDAILEGYSVVGKVLKEEMQDQAMSLTGKAIETAKKQETFSFADTLNRPAVTPDKVKSIVEKSNQELIPTAAQVLATGTMALTDSIINRAGRGVHIEGLNPEFASRFAAMAKEYMDTTGKKLTITDAFRSREEQARLYALKPNLAAPPGRSRHEKGIAIDMDSMQANELYKSGLMEKYGFYRPMFPPWGGGPGKKTEPWHIELAKNSQVGDAYPAVKLSQKEIARLQVGDAYANADMLASAASASGMSMKNVLGGLGRETGATLLSMANIISNNINNAISNRSGSGSGSQTDPVLQSILTGDFG